MFPEQIELTVTRRHAEQGQPGDCHACAIGMALVERFPSLRHEQVYVNPLPDSLFDAEEDSYPEVPSAMVYLNDGIKSAYYRLPLEACAYGQLYDDEAERKEEDGYHITHLPEGWPDTVTFTLRRIRG